jgi:hypothetical protein
MPDQELWRLQKPGIAPREIRCTVRRIHFENDSSNGPVWRELRLEHNGEVYLTELWRTVPALEFRTQALRQFFEDTGWRSPSIFSGSRLSRIS